MRILIVDGDLALRRPLALLLDEAGHSVVTESDGESALARALVESFDTILCDVQLAGLDGHTFLRQYRASGGKGLVIMMSAFGSEEDAFIAMREGAYDYVRKPFAVDEVLLTLRKAEERERTRSAPAVGHDLPPASIDTQFVGESSAMRHVLTLVNRAAAEQAPVLIRGEPGTGKEFIARAIHQRSDRGGGPFIGMTCDAIPEALLATELFGDAHGDATTTAMPGGAIASAADGSLFLSQVHALASTHQGELASRMRQHTDTGPRWIAASDQDLDRAVLSGAFEPAFLELFALVIPLPALRERRDDIPSLVTHFVHRIATRSGRSVSLTPRALQALVAHDWPGNIRGLRQVLERASTLSASGRLDHEDLQLDLQGGEKTEPIFVGDGLALKPQVEALERQVITRALTATGGNRREASKLLRVSLRTLFYKLRRYGLEV